MEREEIRPGMRVQIVNTTKYGTDRWLAPAQVLSVVHPIPAPPTSGSCFSMVWQTSTTAWIPRIWTTSEERTDALLTFAHGCVGCRAAASS